MTDRLKDLEAQERALALDLTAIRVAIKEERMALAGIAPGDLVRARFGRQSPLEVCRVASVNVHTLSRPWLTVNRRNKTGEWSKAERHVYGDWEKVDD
jgi:hypothetical protein